MRHDQLFEDSDQLDLFEKDLELLKDLYWNQSACMRVNGEYSRYTDIERGVRQGCLCHLICSITTVS